MRGFDGGGLIAVLEDTNDIGFSAVRVADGHGVEPGIWFRLMLGGITAQPSAFEGDSFLLISVAVVVLGGTSLLGGRGYPLATVVAAVFLEQLVQFVVALGVSTAVQIIVQAVALAIGVSLYTVNWKALLTRRPVRSAPTPA